MNTRDYMLASIQTIDPYELCYAAHAGIRIQASILIDPGLINPITKSKHKPLVFKSIPKFSI